MRDLSAADAIRRIRDRTVAASGLPVEELKQGAAVDAEPDVVLRRLLADAMRPEDLNELLDAGLLVEVTSEFLSALVSEVLECCRVTDMDGEPVPVRIAVDLSSSVGAMTYTAIGQWIGVGLFMRREGEHRSAPASCERPSHGGYPEA